MRAILLAVVLVLGCREPDDLAKAAGPDAGDGSADGGDEAGCQATLTKCAADVYKASSGQGEGSCQSSPGYAKLDCRGRHCYVGCKDPDKDPGIREDWVSGCVIATGGTVCVTDCSECR